jgi:hypothetical protein
MAVEYICDGCGKREKGSTNRMGDSHKPSEWYQRTDDDGTQHACSRRCIDIVASKSGKTDLVLPI